MFVSYLVTAKVWGHDYSFVVDFSDVFIPVSFWTFVLNPTITLTPP